MKWKSVRLHPKLGGALLGCLYLSLILAACSPTPPNADQTTLSADEGQPASAARQPQSGKKLTELAGQASMPNEAASTVQQDLADEQALYVGRYHVKISCKDDFVQCSEGSAEYILTLAADGSAYRSIVYTGKLFSEKLAEDSNIRTYRRDTWSVNPEDSELVVHLEEGAEFYYRVDKQQNLILDLDRTLDLDNQINQHLFAAGYPMPTQTYRLIKDQ
ncbi:hypothetical protein E0H82_07340 [Acinetobacter sp. ANC 4910]|uniref:hypothetical protein n=1 Tax=Acinetobacter sp. ANC 4910 TaxID=2529850 RepID=UPI0010F3A8DB|nr:hypothetical protein [Acinetobacter sp. ANC 4910]TCB35789.1 hypothetical protein E0H82_07340 [Acinetobacter sp. ANC 4910]